MGGTDGAPLGGPDERFAGLPASWRAAMRLCPFCSGLGAEDGAVCTRCEGSGDLMGTMLLAAYRRGVEHTIARIKELEEARRAQVRAVREEEPSQRQLRSAMGMGMDGS